MTSGRIRRLPTELDQLLVRIQQNEQLPSVKKAFIRLKDYAIVGREVERLGKGFGIKVIK
jgi:hypothetical protein